MEKVVFDVFINYVPNWKDKIVRFLCSRLMASRQNYDYFLLTFAPQKTDLLVIIILMHHFSPYPISQTINYLIYS